MVKKMAKRSTINRRKKSQLFQGNPDRLTDLPNALIIQILCLLELKDIVKLCVLSKRWYQLCTEVHNIVLRFDFVPDILSFNQTQMRLERYASSINNIFMRGYSRIRNFSFSGFDSFGYLLECPKLRNSIECVLESNVEILKLDFNGFKNCTPLSLFQCSSLTQLELSRSLIILQVPVNLPLLKSLTLNRIGLANVHLEDILMGCPVLETLVLVDINTGINLIRIVSPSLKTLKIVGIQYVGPGRNVDLTLVISVSSLQELEISGCFMFRQCVTGDLSTLEKANLMFTISRTIFVDDNGAFVYSDDTDMVTEFYKDWIRMVEGLLESICHVGELLVGSEILQVLSVRASALLRKPLTFMCKHMTVVSPLWKYDLPGIIHLLEVAPHLETLVIGVVSNSEINPPIDQAREALLDVPLQFISNVTGHFLHLKNVTICYQRNSCGDCPLDSSETERKCLDFELVDYILRSCVSLKRILLRSSRTCTNGSCLNPYCAFQYVNRLSSKLLTRSLPQKKNAGWELNRKTFALEYTFSN